ncbi:hypothetical protein BC834DRAFT_896022 [Gloeopeniophorella convolvens]|nr:hypothetical protein BC834DRAFT_896022 [Gloeopeniophorella convolvens]
MTPLECFAFPHAPPPRWPLPGQPPSSVATIVENTERVADPGPRLIPLNVHPTPGVPEVLVSPLFETWRASSPPPALLKVEDWVVIYFTQPEGHGLRICLGKLWDIYDNDQRWVGYTFAGYEVYSRPSKSRLCSGRPRAVKAVAFVPASWCKTRYSIVPPMLGEPPRPLSVRLPPGEHQPVASPEDVFEMSATSCYWHTRRALKAFGLPREAAGRMHADIYNGTATLRGLIEHSIEVEDFFMNVRS